MEISMDSTFQSTARVPDRTMIRAELEETRAAFRWHIPARYNIGGDVCDRQADARPESVALIFEAEDGSIERVTFRELRARTNRFANALVACGLKPGDRVGVLLQQCPEAGSSRFRFSCSSARRRWFTVLAIPAHAR